MSLFLLLNPKYYDAGGYVKKHFETYIKKKEEELTAPINIPEKPRENEVLEEKAPEILAYSPELYREVDKYIKISKENERRQARILAAKKESQRLALQALQIKQEKERIRQARIIKDKQEEEEISMIMYLMDLD